MFSVIEKIVTQIDWNIIGYQNTTNELFDNILFMYVDFITTYSNFNKYILQVDTTAATTNNNKNKGWFHFSREFLPPLINTRDALFSDYWNLGIGKG